jgi:YbbR domain-containing protein
MIGNAVTKVISNKVFYVTISIIFSILLWLYVVNVVNKNIEVTISGIAVEYLGEDDILLDRNLLISEDDRQTVSLTILGKRSVVTGLNRDNIKISVDLTKVKNPGVVERYYEITMPENVSERDYQIKGKTPAIITVDIVRLVSKPVQVKGTFIGTVAEGYLRQPMEFSPDTIKVSGPEEVVSQIDHAEAVIERENLSETVVTELSYVLVDKTGKQVNTDKITTDAQTVEVRLPILQVKQVVLAVELVSGGGADKEKNTQVVINPRYIELSGDPELLESINTITVGTIDLSKIRETFSQTYPIPIPNNVENVYNVTEAKVNLEIIGLVSKRMIITKFETINVAEGYTVAIPTQNLNITIRGPADQVAMVEAHNIRVVIDLSEFGQYVGLTSIEPEVYVDGFPQVGVIRDYSKVTVSIAKEVESP